MFSPQPHSTRVKGTVAPIRAQCDAIPEARRWLVSSEGAFGYLTRYFGRKALYLWPVNADQQGAPQQGDRRHAWPLPPPPSPGG